MNSAIGETGDALASVACLATVLWLVVSIGLGAAPGARWVEYVGVAFHLALLPLVAGLPGPEAARAMGYAWIAFDVVISVTVINGGVSSAAMPSRLGAHVLGTVWIVAASLGLALPVRVLGLVLAACFGGHSLLASPTRRPILLYASGPLMLAWLAMTALDLAHVL